MNNIKSFDTFEAGIEEICNLVPNLKEYIKDARTEYDVVKNLMDAVLHSYPSIYNAEYPSTYAFSISAHEVGFKTRSAIAFGWRYLTNEATNKVTYGFRVSFNTSAVNNRRHYMNPAEKILSQNGWKCIPITDHNKKKVQPPTKPTRKPIGEKSHPKK